MQMFKIAGIAVATTLAVTPSAFAQTPAQTPGKAATIQTFTGCVMTEPDYRRAHNLGEGAAKGLGLGDEFVLVDVNVSPAKSTTAMAPSSATPAMSASASTSKCADQGQAYRLTGTAEEKIKGLVGHQLEVQGRFKHPDDVPAKPGELPAEVEIVSFREAPAAAAVSEPPAAPPATVATPRTPAPVTAPAPATQPKELPHTASSAPLLALVGVVALGSGLALTLLRRRAA
ncbi:MAG TPA: LPXTG cell wall anchor domain-containing protein [Vicinamibacterales bacterium]|nr:LPXTG cell wall anchor domain-containing protein [Vicinamibacterales bacterium]